MLPAVEPEPEAPAAEATTDDLDAAAAHLGEPLVPQALPAPSLTAGSYGTCGYPGGGVYELGSELGVDVGSQKDPGKACTVGALLGL